jgi:N-acetylglucosamine kinase-like BadF-type ATPase
VRLGEAIVRNHLEDAARAACSSAGISIQDVHRVCAGVAGASLPTIRTAVRDILMSILPLSAGQVQVLGDMEVALENALADAPGVVVMAGTGSIAFGRNQVGQTARAGGWGWAISDEGSGHWIGRTAVATMVRAHDNGESTALTRAIFREWGVETLSDALQVANASPGPDYARLFPAVLAAEQIADPLARQVLGDSGRELAILAATVIRRLWSPGQQVRVAIGGSIFRHAGAVRQAFLFHLRREHPEVCVSFGMVNPAEGALSLARKMAIAESARAPRAQ